MKKYNWVQFNNLELPGALQPWKLPKSRFIGPSIFLGVVLLMATVKEGLCQAVVGRTVRGAGARVYYDQGGTITNNGLITYEYLSGGRVNGTFPGTGFIDLNELSVNLAASPVPTGKLTLSKVIGRDGDRVVLSWNLD